MLPSARIDTTARAPLVLSTTALVLSAAALLVSLSRSPPHSAAQPAAAAAAPAPRPHQVTLNGLVIGSGEIEAGAVGTQEIANGAVTADKLAEAAVTSEHLNPDAIRHIARQVSHSRYLVGEVDEAGTAVIGLRFTSKRVSTGEYVVHFDEPFPAPPVVVASAQSYGSCYAPTQTLDAASVRIRCMSDLLGSAPHLANTRFAFYAAPPL